MSWELVSQIAILMFVAGATISGVGGYLIEQWRKT
jgi:hypothetical protein